MYAVKSKYFSPVCWLEKLFSTVAWSAVFGSWAGQCKMLASHLAINMLCASRGGASCSCLVCNLCVCSDWITPHALCSHWQCHWKHIANSCPLFAALQSPIEYQRKESSSAVLRPQTGRVPQPNSRPYSSVPVESEKPLKATSRNPSLPPLKISTSNGSTGYEHSQPGDKYEQSKVLSSSDKTWSHSPFLIP